MRTAFTFVLPCMLTSPCSFASTQLAITDTLMTDSSQVKQETILMEKIVTMETELDNISDQLSEISTSQQADVSDTKKKFVHFGLSLGYRWLTSSSTAQNEFASVSPIDSTLRLTQLDRTSYLFSTSVVFDLNLGKLRTTLDEEAFREKRIEKQSDVNNKRIEKKKAIKSFRTQRTTIGRFLNNSIDHLCIVSNLNILDFSNGQKELAFNKSIEGGLGVGYKLNETMYIGFNWEHVQSLQLYDDIKKFEGKKIELNGDNLKSSAQLDLEDQDLFYKKNLSGWSIKMIICL
jgi:hypothetical protein